MFIALPLLAIPVVLYNLIAVAKMAGGAATSTNTELTRTLFSIPMASGASWSLTSGDLLILLSLFMLFFELLKATTSRRVAIVNHSLSMIVFIVCLVEFLLVPAFATSVFFLITMMTLLDVLAGFIVTIITARKDFDFAAPAE
jgi:hypothetical protein